MEEKGHGAEGQPAALRGGAGKPNGMEWFLEEPSRIPGGLLEKS